MRNILTLIGAATVTFVGLGWYLGWYQISRLPSSDGHQSLHVDINKVKIVDDVQAGLSRGSEFVEQIRDKNGKPETDKPAPLTTPASTGTSKSWLNPVEFLPQGRVNDYPAPTSTSNPPPASTPISKGWQPLGTTRIPTTPEEERNWFGVRFIQSK